MVQDFAGLSSRVSVYSSNDDYGGQFMTNPMVPKQYTNVMSSDVIIGRHVVIGSGSVILPSVTLEIGVAVGALSLLNKNCSEFGVYFWAPVRRINDRKKDLLELEVKLKKYGSI